MGESNSVPYWRSGNASVSARPHVAKARLLDASRMELQFLNNKSYNTTDMTKLGYGADPLHVNSEGYSVAAVPQKTDRRSTFNAPSSL